MKSVIGFPNQTRVAIRLMIRHAFSKTKQNFIAAAICALLLSAGCSEQPRSLMPFSDLASDEEILAGFQNACLGNPVTRVNDNRWRCTVGNRNRQTLELTVLSLGELDAFRNILSIPRDCIIGSSVSPTLVHAGRWIVSIAAEEFLATGSGIPIAVLDRLPTSDWSLWQRCS
jgi:hypothetical protein